MCQQLLPLMALPGVVGEVVVVGVVAVVMAAVVAMASACASGLVGGDGVWGLLPASTTKFTPCSVNRQYGETNERTVGQNIQFLSKSGQQNTCITTDFNL
jgi:hypothetical protein